jgi:hypothetical protein
MTLNSLRHYSATPETSPQTKTVLEAVFFSVAVSVLTQLVMQHFFNRKRRP